MSSPIELNRLAQQLRNVATNLNTRASRGLLNSTLPLMDELRRRSPVYKGKFRSGWTKKVRTKANGSMSIEIYNRTPVYGVFVEGGSEPGQRPWPRAFSPPEGSTIEYEGRIYPYAVPGGTIEIVFNSFDSDKLHQNIADIILGGLDG